MLAAMVEPSEIARRQRAKNLAIGLTVAGTCVLFFVITILRMGIK